MNIISKTARVSDKATITPPIKVYPGAVIHDKVKIGKYSYLGNNTRVGNLTTIGNYCSIARDSEIAPVNHPTDYLSTHPFQYNNNHFTQIKSYSDHQRVKPPIASHTVVGHDVWLGAGSMICQGVTVNTGAIVAGGTVVTNDVPPYAIVGGVPAKVLKYRFSEQTIELLLQSEWWLFNPTDMSGIEFSDIERAISQIELLKIRTSNQNSAELANVITNSASVSKSGILWFSTSFGHSNPKALEKYNAIEIISHNSTLENSPLLQPGIFPINQASYDEIRGWYRITFLDNGNPYDGLLEKSSVSFKLTTT